MKSTYITLDDPRVTLNSTRPGRVFSLNGKDKSKDYPIPHTVHTNGYHIEPRMSSIFSSPKSFNFNPGDYAKINIDDTPLLGIALELADHHFDIRVLIDGYDIYQDFYCLSSYLPSSDGFGYIHWLLLDRDQHEISLVVSDQYNRMLEASKIQPSHACISGFILMDEINFPPPVYQGWMYSQDPLPPDTRGRSSSFDPAPIPPGGTCYLMDLFGQGTLENLAFQVDRPVILEIMDGGASQPEYPHDFPSWMRRAYIGQSNGGALGSVIDVIQPEGQAGFQAQMTKPVKYASRLLVRVKNNSEGIVQISNLYMEGTSRCM